MNDERIEVGSPLSDLGWWGALEMFLFVFSSLWVFVLENEVDLGLSISDVLPDRLKATYLVRGTALVRAKHDYIRRGVGEFFSVESLVVLE